MKAMTGFDKLQSYLYETEYTDYDYDAGRAWYEGNSVSFGACSAVRRGNFCGFNFDYPYDGRADFAIHTAKPGLHKSVGTASAIPQLTQEVVDSGEYVDAYAIVPFATVDGINEKGVLCKVNVVPTGDMGSTTGTNPTAEETIYTPMVVRYVLDYADSADDAITRLQSVNIVKPPRITDEVHWMIADKDKTYIVETVQNELKVIENHSVMSNFYLYGFDGNTATAFYKASAYDPDTTTLTAHANGLERYDILMEHKDEVIGANSMRKLMERVWYTKTYSSEKWYSEFLGEHETFGNLTINSVAEDFSGIYKYAQKLYRRRVRNGETWQTVHSCVYDIAGRKMYIVAQESGKQFTVHLDKRKRRDFDMAISYLRNAECYSIKGEAPILIRGDSTDEKPVDGIPANSVFEELDTGKKYYFDSGEWKEKAGSGGGSGDMLAADYDADGAVKEAGGIADYVAEHGSGLPDPSSYDDGTVLIKVGNEWKAQSGYGYEKAGAFESITWDGETEGRATVMDFFHKVSDVVLSADKLNGSTAHVEGFGDVIIDDAEEISGLAYSTYVLSGYAGAAIEDVTIPETGTYFMGDNTDVYVSSLTAPSSVQTIDPKFIHSDIPPAPSDDGTYVLTCTVVDGEPTYTWESAGE